MLRSGHLSSLLVDVDRSTVESLPAAAGRSSLAEAVTSGAMSADFAVVRMNHATWVFYDRDLDGTRDTVLVRVTDDSDDLRNAFTRDESGAFVHAPELVEGPLVRPELFPREQRAAFAELAEALFRGD